MHSGNKTNPRKKSYEKFWYDLLKSIFVTVKIIRISSDHAVLSWVYNNYKSFLGVETYYILLETHNSICFEILMQEFDTLFYYTFQEGPKQKLVNINIIQIKYVISTYQTDHIMKNSIQ